MLIEITEGIEKGGSPRVPAASCVGCFSDPERLARIVTIAQTGVKRIDLIRTRKPLFGKRRRSRCLRSRAHACTSLRNCCIEVVREDIKNRSGGLQQILGAEHAAVRRHRKGTTFSNRTWAEEQDAGRSLLEKRTKHSDIAPVIGSVISLRRSTHRGDVGLVHEFGSGEAPPNRFRI